MIREGLSDDDDEDDDKQFLGAWEMIMLSVATSLDAMAVGLTFAFFTNQCMGGIDHDWCYYLWYILN